MSRKGRPRPPMRGTAASALSASLFALGATVMLDGQSALGEPTRAISAIDQLTGCPQGSGFASASGNQQRVSPLANQAGTRIDGVEIDPMPFAPFSSNEYDERCLMSRMMGDIDLMNGAYTPHVADIRLSSPVGLYVIARSYNPVQRNGGSRHVSDGLQGNNWFQTGLPYIAELSPCGDTGSSSQGAPEIADCPVDEPWLGWPIVSGPTYHVERGPEVISLVWGAGSHITLRQTTTLMDMQESNPTGMVWCYDPAEPYSPLVPAPGGAAQTQWEVYRTVGGPFAFAVRRPSIVREVLYDEPGDPGTCLAKWRVCRDEYVLFALDGSRHHFVGTRLVGSVVNPFTPNDAGKHISSTFPDGKSRTGWGSPSGVTDTAGRTYTFSYNTAGRLSGVDVTGVKSVEYSYYIGSSSPHGSDNDLKLVKISTPVENGTLEEYTYYRYYKDSLNSLIKMVVEPEGVRRFLASGQTLGTLETVSDDDLRPYSSYSFDYASDYAGRPRISKVIMDGNCGCASSASGTFYFAYAFDSATQESITTITQPDGSQMIRWFDRFGQPLSSATVSSTGDAWATKVTRDALGFVETVHSPANCQYNPGTGTISTFPSTGLVTKYERFTTSPNLTLTGLPKAVLLLEGDADATPDKVAEWDYDSRERVFDYVGGAGIWEPTIPVVFRTAAKTFPSGTAITTQFQRTWWSGVPTDAQFIRAKSITTVLPAVGTGSNGSGLVTSAAAYLRVDGSVAFTQDPSGVISYNQRDTNGRTVRTITDLNSASGGSIPDSPGGWGLTTLPADGLNVERQMAYDAQDRLLSRTEPDYLNGTRTSKYVHAKLVDNRRASIGVPLTSGATSYGPMSYSVINLAGKPEFSGTIRIGSSGVTAATSTWINAGSGAPVDPLAALSTTLAGTGGSNVAQVSQSFYSESGHRLLKSRSYHTQVATLSPFTPGAGPHPFDESTLTYDVMGRVETTTNPAGTVSKNTYDTLGRVVERLTGVGTALTSVEEIEYDNGADGGNSHVTKRTLKPGGSSVPDRVTEYQHDWRGRLLVQENPQSPHTVIAYDNLNRPVAVGTYSSVTGWVDPVTTPSGRLSLSQTLYDERGQTFRRVEHEVIQSSGALGSSITTNLWYDETGQVVKTTGPTLSKTLYDRLHRPVRRYELASVDEAPTNYAAAFTVAGDIVAEQTRTVYDTVNDSGLPVMQVSVRRHHNDTTTTGDLESPASEFAANPAATATLGRMQISAMWYDQLGRSLYTAQIGSPASAYTRASGGTYNAPPASAPAGPVVMTTD